MSKTAEALFMMSIGTMFTGLMSAIVGKFGLEYDLPGFLLVEGVPQDVISNHLIDTGEMCMGLGALSAVCLPVLVLALGGTHFNNLKHHDE